LLRLLFVARRGLIEKGRLRLLGGLVALADADVVSLELRDPLLDFGAILGLIAALLEVGMKGVDGALRLAGLLPGLADVVEQTGSLVMS
jgi:hypothetical protein